MKMMNCAVRLLNKSIIYMWFLNLYSFIQRLRQEKSALKEANEELALNKTAQLGMTGLLCIFYSALKRIAFLLCL